MSPWEMLFWITFWTERVQCLGTWDPLWDAEKEHFRIAQDLLWDVWEEPNMGKERDQGGANMGKEGIKFKKHWSHVNKRLIRP